MPKIPPEPTFRNLFFPPGPDKYKYFDGGAANKFDVKNDGLSNFDAWWMAEAAMLVYARCPEGVEKALQSAGLGKVLLFSDDDLPNCRGTQGFIAECETFAVAAFRGTEVLDPKDSLTDLMFKPERWENAEIHSGFEEALLTVWDRQVAPRLADIRSRNASCQICFTGHSLGAALATLAAARFNDPNTSLFTYGSPRVGNAAFAGDVKQRVRRRFRFVNGTDVVTRVPPESAWYTHVSGVDRFISEDGGKVSDQDPGHQHPNIFTRLQGEVQKSVNVFHDWIHGQLSIPLEALRDHTPGRYVAFLYNWYEGHP